MDIFQDIDFQQEFELFKTANTGFMGFDLISVNPETLEVKVKAAKRAEVDLETECQYHFNTWLEAVTTHRKREFVEATFNKNLMVIQTDLSEDKMNLYNAIGLIARKTDTNILILDHTDKVIHLSDEQIKQLFNGKQLTLD